MFNFTYLKHGNHCLLIKTEILKTCWLFCQACMTIREFMQQLESMVIPSSGSTQDGVLPKYLVFNINLHLYHLTNINYQHIVILHRWWVRNSTSILLHIWASSQYVGSRYSGDDTCAGRFWYFNIQPPRFMQKGRTKCLKVYHLASCTAIPRHNLFIQSLLE